MTFRDIHAILNKLDSLPTLAQGQAADLKYDNGKLRVWVSRCGPEDGETQPIQTERLVAGRWIDTTEEEVDQ